MDFNSMKNKNILIQDVSKTEELQRFIGHNIYRRPQEQSDKVDSIDFFAPYFTLPAKDKMGINGICYYSPILFILENITLANAAKTFAAEREKLQKVFGNLSVSKWESGLNLLNDNPAEPSTYYFLGEPIALKKPILKQNPPSGALNLNSILSWNLIKPMSAFCEDAAL